ncbi:unnamed protein product [Paramecium primaurelia]|uniref:Uncharacterized protein n=1 Tax=Paramecium primaurelia TaxID=5886 RepID=A0A8S1MA53_PARPR|nr:unnamed protein product [Paramecium primaurelia]
MCKQHQPIKRVKERTIIEAKQKVDQWRCLYKNGGIDENGKKIKYSLKKAAEKVGVPKKSLEDYRYLLRKAQFLVDLNKVGDKRMGFLRLIIKQQLYNQKQQPQGWHQTVAEYKHQLKKLENQQHFEDMIVEGDTIKQAWDDDILDLSNYLQPLQPTVNEQEGIHVDNFEIGNLDDVCKINGQLTLIE